MQACVDEGVVKLGGERQGDGRKGDCGKEGRGPTNKKLQVSMRRQLLVIHFFVMLITTIRLSVL